MRRGRFFKIILAIFFLLMIAIVAIYIMIPATLTVATIRTVAVSMPGAVRYLNQDSIWKTRLTCSGTPFSITRRLPNAFELVNHSTLVPNPTQLLLIQSHPDSISIKWETHYEGGLNPFKRIISYNRAVEFKRCTQTLLNETRDFLQDNKNLYGFSISRTTLTDTFLVSMKFESRAYPSVDLIYSRIDSIKRYISSSGAVETNLPMINVRQNPNGMLIVMIGVATNKPLPDSAGFSTKRLAQYKNRTLTTELRGGNEVVDEAIKAMIKYMDDYRVTNPTTYFEMLVTDRRQEKDPSKWITRIFYPIV